MTKTGSHKSAFSSVVTIVALILSALVLSTCKGPLFGLGGAVDLEAPRSIEVTPGSGSYRSGVIAVSGVAEDAYGLASASVSVLDKATGQVLRTYPATVSGSTWTTGAVVDTTQFPDGQYTVAVTLKDARGNSSEDRVLIGFDNSAPTVLVEEPLDLDAEYNGYITLAGQAHDSMSSIVSVTVGVYRASDSSLVDEFLSATVPKWAVQFNAADPAYSLTLADLVLVVQATDEGGNTNTWQYEYKPLATANAGSPVTASLVNQLESQAQDTDTVDGLTFNKATLLSYRSFLDPAVPVDASILKVNVDSDKPTFTFVTPGEASISEATAERYAGGTKANGTISDDDNNETMLAWYRYVPSTGNIEDGAWTPATVEGSGYDQRWSFNLPGTNGIYKIQVRAQDKIVAGSPTADSVFGESAVRYVIVDDGRPLVSIDTNNPVPWNLYYGSGQSILVSGSASRTGVGNSIVDVEIQVGSNPWADVTGLSGLGTNTVTWSSHSLSLAGLPGGSTQVRVRAQDNLGVWGQAEVLIIMDVDAPVITISDPGVDLNGSVTFRGITEDGAADAFITVLDRVQAKLDAAFTADPDDGTEITGTYSWSWLYNTQSLSDGGHTLYIRAWDTAGNSSTTSRAFTVLQSTDKPSVAVNNLAGGEVIGGTFTVSGTASDDDGVASVDDGIQILIEREDPPATWTVYQAWTDIASRSGSPSAYSWTYALPSLPSGSYRVSVRARDINSVVGDYGSAALPQANYWASTAALAINVDNDVPVVNQAAFVPATGSYVNAGFTLSGTITEDKGLSAVTVYVNGTARGSATVTGAAPTYSFEFAVDQAWLTGVGGANAIRVDATDTSDPAKTGSGQIQVIFDDSEPSASFLTPDDGSTVNGLIAVSGTASDNNQVSALYYAVATSAPAWPGGYTLLTGQKYSFNFTLDTTAYTDDTAYTVYVVAVDGAGNDSSLSPATLAIDIDQDSDRPIIKLSNVDPDGLPSQTTLKMSNTVYGSVSDDDGTLTSLEVSEDGSAWSAVTLSGGTFSYDSSAGDGVKTLWFRVVDKLGRSFATNAAASADRPRIENGAPGIYIESTVSYSVDTKFPDVFSVISTDRTAAYDFADAVDLVNSMSFGGSSGVFKVRVLATDESGIGSVSVAVPGASGSPFAATANGTEVQGGTTYTRYDTGLIDVTSGITDGALTVTIGVTDASDLTSTLIRTIIIDNTAPSYSVTTPAMNEVVNGDITIKGTALDQTAGLASVEYKLGYNHAGEAWAPVDGSIYSWEIDLTGANKSDLYAGKAVTADYASDYLLATAHGLADGTMVFFSAATLPGGLSAATTYYVRDSSANQFKVALAPAGLAVNITSNGSDVFASAESKDPDNDQIWDFPILLRATDNAGNQIVTTVTDYVIKLDPGGDRPRVTVSYPDEPGKTLGGTIRVYGLATDDDAVNSVYMQVDDTGDGVADTDSLGTDWYNGGLGQPVTGSANWYRIINQSGEFDPVSGTNTIHIRARGQDIYGTYGAWTAWQEIIIDKNVPQFGSQSNIALDPDATPASGNEDVYAVGMWVNGATVYLRGSITDDGGITAIEVDGSVSGSLALNPTWFTAGYSGTGYDMAIPITLDAGASGVKQLTITAYDNSATPRESVFEVRFNYDNQAPTATLNAAASPAAVAQSDGWYKVKGTALDDGSDIDRVEVYFVRRGDGSTTFDRIYNPGQTNTWALLSSVDFTDNYPTLQGTASRGTEFTLTHAALANNKLIAVGQKILVGPELRTISDYDSATGLITWADGTVLTSETSYTIRLGLQVDHKDTIETSAVAQGTVDRSAGQEKTLVDPALSSNTDISVGDTLKINGEYRIIDTWTPGTGTITWTGLDVAVGAGQAYEVYSVLNDDIDHYVEYLKQTSGIEYTWSVDIKSDAIPDGPIEIHYVAFDTAGNRTHYQSTGYKVQNNGPRVGAIVLGSDLDGNGSVDPLTETVQYEYDSDTALTETKAFALTVKDGPMYIEPVVTNGNGDLHLWMTGAHTLSDYALRTAGTVDPIEVIDDAELAAMGDGSRTFTMAIWDETEETEPNVDSLSITRGATVTVDYVDGVKPHAAIRPFYWNDGDDNSLFENSRDNGHIEITGVTLYGTSDPDVSGKISVRGMAYDDQRITAIYAYMDGYTFTGGTTKTIGAYTYTLLSTYSGGSWTDVDQWATNGWKATVTDAGIGQDGHRISWQLDIDTGNSTNFASLADTDRIIRVVVEDRAVSPSLETATASTLTGTGTRPAINSIVVTPDPDIKPGQLVVLGSGDQAYASRISSYDAGTIVFASAVDQAITAYTIYLDGHQNPLYQVDVVPYITSIVRASNSTRSRLGKYPLRNSEANVVVSGFNLFTSATQDTDNWIRIYSAATAGNSDADALVIEAAPAPSTSSFEMTMNANSNSGWFRLSVNGIEAINNIDDNAKEWNKETDPSNAASTAAWTDDRYLMLFRTGDSFRESLDPEYVSMSFDSDLNRLVGQWSNSGYASTYYGTPVADGNTRTSVFSTYDPPTWTDVFVDTDGDIHSLYLDDSTNGGGTWGYLRTEINNGSIGYIEVLGDDDESTPNSADGMDEKLHQFRNARIAVRSGTNDQYISYYDYYAKCLKYSRVINGTETFVSDYHRTDSATVVDGNDYFTLNPVPALDVGMWSDIQVDDIGGTDTTTWRPVIVYYDNTNEKLKLARGESSQPNGTADWTLQDVDVASTTGVNEGQYLGSGSLSMKMDAAGNLHIVTRNGLEGGLYYIYADNIDGTGTYVFEPPVCIDPQTADGTWADITLNGNSPMVSYKNGTSYKGLKYAYVASGTGLSSSDWEYMVVPSATAVADQRTNIEYTASATDFPYDSNVAFGYAASNFQIIYLRRQVP